jgi:hypothetical protein
VQLPPRRIQGRFAGFKMPAGEHQTDAARPMPILAIDDDTSLRRFREDTGKRWHLELVIVRDAAPIRRLVSTRTFRNRAASKTSRLLRTFHLRDFGIEAPIYEHGEQIQSREVGVNVPTAGPPRDCHGHGLPRPWTSRRISSAVSTPDIILPISSGGVAIIISAESLRPSPERHTGSQPPNHGSHARLKH